MELLIKNIRTLVQTELNPPSMRRGTKMSFLPSVSDAYLVCSGERITAFGQMSELPVKFSRISTQIDASGRIVMPGFCDPHTHLVFAGSRESEFIDRIKGLSYEEIARKGGGILNSAMLLHNTPEDELYRQSAERLREIMYLGTASVEIKSGYGLNLEDELKMLRVIRKLKNDFPVTIKSTFLGAHAFPAEYRNNHAGYVKILVDEMIPAVAKEGLADYIDVFCEEGFFTPAETSQILEAGKRYGLQPKIHANEMGHSGGVHAGVEHGALSVDHLEFTGEEEIIVLKKSSTMPTVLPSTSFFLGLPYAPARKMIDSGLPLALASDYNPGSSPSGDMQFIIALACIKLKMNPREAVNAVTLNSAYAMGVESDHGTISPGRYASFIITREIPGLEYIPYSFTSDHIEHVFMKGMQIR